MSSSGTSFYVTGGTLRLDAPSYVERNADKDLLDGLIASEFCYVLTSRQMGKSSLMVRTANKLRERGVHVVVLDLSAVGQNVTRDQWYNGLLASMGDQLGVEDELDEFWKAHQELSPVQRWFYALAKVVLGRRSEPVTVFIDEIDVVRSLPFSTDEFFAAIRECYNRRAGDPKFCRLTFCLLGVATPGDLVRNTNITPFNIGRRIELDDFTSEDAKPLARGLHTESPRAAELLERVLYWTSGHPYMTQRICLALARDLQAKRPGDVDRRCDELFLNTRARERDDNLIFVRERMLRSDVDLTDLLELYLKTWKGNVVCVDEASPIVSVLRLSGIVRAEGGRLCERNRIYHSVFDQSWVRANLPDTELRRQRVAFRRGVIRTTAVAAVVIIVMTVMILLLADNAKKARRALAEASFSRALEKRGSGIAGQRYESVSALEEASRHYTNRRALRDELIASLAFQDLREKPWNFPLPKAPGCYELNLAGVCASGGTNGTIVVRSLNNGQVLNSLPGGGSPVKRIQFGPGSTLVAEHRGGSSGLTAVWDWDRAEQLFTVPNAVHSEALDFSTDGKKLAVGQDHGRLVVYSLPKGEIVFERNLKWAGGLPRMPQVVRFDPTGERLAESCLEDLNVQVWDLNHGKSKPVSLFHPAPVYDLSWHPGGAFLATACADSTIYLWNLARTDGPVKKLIGHEGEVLAVRFNPHGTLLASAGADETVRLWSPATERNVVFHLEGEGFNRLQFSPNGGELIAVNSTLGKHRRWEISGEEYIALPLWAGSHELRGLDFSPNGSWLVAASRDRATIWSVRTGAEYAFLAMTNARAVGFSSDSRNLIASTENSLLQHSLGAATVPSQAIRHQAEPRVFPLDDNQLGTMALTFDRTTAAVVSVSNVLVVPIGTNRSEHKTKILAGINHYHRLALHPEGKWLAASALERASIDVWDLTKEIPGIAATLPASEYFVFSSDGNWLVTCWKGEFNFYRTGDWSGCFPVPREQPSNQHAPAAFSHDGKMVALAVNRYDIKLFLMPNDGAFRLQLIATLRAPDRQPLEMLAFSPDGRRLAAGTANLMIQVWNLALLRDRLARLDLENKWPSYE